MRTSEVSKSLRSFFQEQIEAALKSSCSGGLTDDIQRGWLSKPLAELELDGERLLGILIEVEEKFQAQIEASEYSMKNFASPETILTLLESKLPVGTGEGPRKPRIVNVLDDYLPHISGPQRMVSEMCEALGDWFEFLVFSFDRDDELAPRDIIENVQVERSYLPTGTDLLRLWRRHDRFVSETDLAPEEHCNYGLASSDVFRSLQDAAPDGIVTWFYSRILAQELVQYYPGASWTLIPSFFQPPGSPDLSNPNWWDPSMVRHLVLAHQAECDRALEWGISPEKIVHLPAPVNTRRFAPAPGVERDPNLLLYAGRLTRRKGIHDFLDILKVMIDKRPGLRFRIVADLESPSPGERLERDRIIAKTRSLGLGKHVELAGKKLGEAFVRELSRASIHVLPSTADCISYVTMEALACGASCVNLDFEGNDGYAWQRKVVGGEPLVHLCPTLAEMGDKILDLCERRELPSHRQYMVEHYSWERLRYGYRDVLQDAAAA